MRSYLDIHAQKAGLGQNETFVNMVAFTDNWDVKFTDRALELASSLVWANEPFRDSDVRDACDSPVKRPIK